EYIANPPLKLIQLLCRIPLWSWNKEKKGVVTTIGMSNDVWTALHQQSQKRTTTSTDDSSAQLGLPSELKLFETKHASGNPNVVLLPLNALQKTQGHASLYFIAKGTDPVIVAKTTQQFVNDLNDALPSLSSSSSSSSSAVVFAHLTVKGFKYLSGKDLTGFIDGTKNLDYNLRLLADTVTIRDNDAH
ncbi:hypothetical protein RFI_12399, partial [Reticulomyxa filosa]